MGHRDHSQSDMTKATKHSSTDDYNPGGIISSEELLQRGKGRARYTEAFAKKKKANQTKQR